MYTKATVNTGAREADESAEFGGGPLWRGGVAVDARDVAGEFLEGEELGRVLEEMRSIAKIE